MNKIIYNLTIYNVQFFHADRKNCTIAKLLHEL